MNRLQHRGALDDALCSLFALPRQGRPGMGMGSRIMKLLHYIDGHDGRAGWDLDRACRELRLEISDGYGTSTAPDWAQESTRRRNAY